MNKHLKKLAAAALLIAIGCGQEVKIVVVEPMNFSFTKKTQSEKLEVKAQDIRGADIPGIGFTFKSEDSSVATVDSDGLVKPAGNGSTAIIAETTTGIKGEAFVKVCLPKDLICEPADKLELKVGLAAPIKCHVTDCKDNKIPARITMDPADPKMVLKEGENIFIGLAVGDTEVTVAAFEMKKTVGVHVDEQAYLPGMGPGSGGGGGGGGGHGKGGEGGDPYGGGGRFDHILDNMKFKN